MDSVGFNYSNNIINDVNKFLSTYDSNDSDYNNLLFDDLLNQLEVAMEYEIEETHKVYKLMKDQIINEITRRRKIFFIFYFFFLFSIFVFININIIIIIIIIIIIFFFFFFFFVML